MHKGVYEIASDIINSRNQGSEQMIKKEEEDACSMAQISGLHLSLCL